MRTPRILAVAASAAAFACSVALAPAGATPAASDWPTYHRDASRAGAAPAGPPLGRVRRLWSGGVDAAAYAEPLVAGGKVIVATENDSVYAFDAGSGRLAWRTHLGTPVNGDDLPCGDINPSGITGTPVVDAARRVVYVVAFVRGFHHTLAALDLATGAVRWGRGVDPPGADPRVHQQRGALALSRGRVYVPYGGLDGDCGDYHGWVVGAPAGGPRGRLAAFRVPTHREGGIWAPSGPAVDTRGNVYVATGNGDSSSFDFGNAVIRLTPGLRRIGFFAPRNAPSLNGSDTDLGSVGPLLVPGRRAFVIGKDGIGYLLRTAHLGRIGHPLAARHLCPAAYGGLAFEHGTIYIPCTDGVLAVRLAGLRPLWRGPGSKSSPIVAGRGVWLIDGRTLEQLDARSGRLRFSASIGDTATFATPAAGAGRVYAVGGGRVVAFG
jgi:outer membrane protein assembly factor BamB